MSQVRIDVNGFLARRNKEEGREDPAIRITYPNGEKNYCKRLTILGPSAMIQTDVDREHPNQPYIWLETESDIEYE